MRRPACVCEKTTKNNILKIEIDEKDKNLTKKYLVSDIRRPACVCEKNTTTKTVF